MPRAEIPESVEQYELAIEIGRSMFKDRAIGSPAPDGGWLKVEDIPKLHQHWLEQLKEELLEDAVCWAAYEAAIGDLPDGGRQNGIETARALIQAAIASIPIEEGEARG
jgi:hypothetical protein